MRRLASSTLVAACLAAAPAHAGDFFIGGQLGRVDLDSEFGDDRSELVQGSVGYRWGIRYAQVGLEAGIGRFDEVEDQTRFDYTGGSIDRAYTLSSRYGFAGLNARVKPPVVPVYFMGRVGVLGMQRTLDETSIDRAVNTAPVTQRRSFKENSGGTYAGVGVGTTILPLLDVGLMYTQYRYSQVQYDPVGDQYRLSDDKRDARSVSLMVEFRF